MSLANAKWPSGSLGDDDFFNKNNKPGYYSPPRAQDFAQQANQFRQIYEEPKRQEITRQLEQAITDAQNQRGNIDANYQSYYNTLNQRERQQGRSDLESAIARGAGRSGVVDYLARNRDREYTGYLDAAEAKRLAELSAVENQLSLVQRQVPTELKDLVDQAARLEAQELQRLQDLDYSRRAEYDMDQFSRMLQVYDRTRLSPLQQLQLYLQMAEIAGNFPKQAPSVYGT